MATRELTLRRADTCTACAAELAAGARARWDAARREVMCLGCVDDTSAPSLDRGTAGVSARREYDRRRTKRETRTREEHPRIGGLLLTLRESPQSETAWLKGGKGEVAVAEALERRGAGAGFELLADRQIPGTRANIDLIAISGTGVYVIDVKAWKGSLKIQRPLLGSPRLLVDGRDRTTALEGLDRQVAVVTGALGRRPAIDVSGALCFTQVDLPWSRTQTIRGHLLLYRKALAKRLSADGPLTASEISAISRDLAAALPAA